MSIDTAPRGTALRAPLLVAAAAAALGAVSIGFSRLTGTSICGFYNLTGLPCPGCGGTRSVLALVQGDWSGALTWNAYGLMLVITTVILWTRWAARSLTVGQVPILVWKRWHILLLSTATAAWFLLRLTPWGIAHLFHG